MKCECGEEVVGNTCMLCKNGVAHDAAEQPAQVHDPRNDARSGVLGGYRRDIGRSVHVMNGSGNTIYNLPYGDMGCTMRLGALSIKHMGRMHLDAGERSQGLGARHPIPAVPAGVVPARGRGL